MAFVTKITCAQCGEDKSVTVGSGAPNPKICHDCQDKTNRNNRAIHLEGLKALSLEDRISLIEQWIYDYKPRVPFSEMRF